MLDTYGSSSLHTQPFVVWTQGRTLREGIGVAVIIKDHYESFKHIIYSPFFPIPFSALLFKHRLRHHLQVSNLIKFMLKPLYPGKEPPAPIE
jgi:hypothetical protein